MTDTDARLTLEALKIIFRPDAVCEGGRLLTHWMRPTYEEPGYWTSFEGENFICPACGGEGCDERDARIQDE